MIIPNKLKVGGVWYKVCRGEFDGQCGEYDAEKQTITINKNLPQEMAEETFIHEILHAINNQLDDREIEFLAQAIYQVLKDNKLLAN